MSVLSLLLIQPVSTEQLAKVEIFKGRSLNGSLTILKDCWIELGEGKEVKIPKVEFYYSGAKNATVNVEPRIFGNANWTLRSDAE